MLEQRKTPHQRASALGSARSAAASYSLQPHLPQGHCHRSQSRSWARHCCSWTSDPDRSRRRGRAGAPFRPPPPCSRTCWPCPRRVRRRRRPWPSAATPAPAPASPPAWHRASRATPRRGRSGTGTGVTGPTPHGPHGPHALPCVAVCWVLARPREPAWCLARAGLVLTS